MNKVFSFIISASILAAGCNSATGDFKKTDTGLEYNLVEDVSGDNAKVGDILVANVQYGTPDSVMFDNAKMGSPVYIQVTNSSFKGSIEEGFTLCSKGDSAIFMVNADSMYKHGFHAEVPEFVKKAGSKIGFNFRIIDVKNEEKEMGAFIKKSGLEGQKTASGMFIQTEGKDTGVHPIAGQKVKMHYTGKLLTGEKFDSSLDRNEPFEFTLGKGEVIPGWDEGVALLSKGQKATFVIPSFLAYGARGVQKIPPFSTLIFEVELIDIAK